MRLEYYIEGEEKVFVINDDYLFQLTLESGLNPSQQVDYVENNGEASNVKYAILFDDEDNVEKMFVRDLF